MNVLSIICAASVIDRISLDQARNIDKCNPPYNQQELLEVSTQVRTILMFLLESKFHSYVARK